MPSNQRKQELADIDQRLMAHLNPSEQTQYAGFEQMKPMPTYSETHPRIPPAKKQKQVPSRAAGRGVKQQKQNKVQELAQRLKERSAMERAIQDKLISSIAYGVGVPGQGIVAKSQHGLDLPPNEQGLPAQGFDIPKFQKSLTPQENEYVQNMVQNYQKQQSGIEGNMSPLGNIFSGGTGGVRQ